jgi:hypothetical protein
MTGPLAAFLGRRRRLLLLEEHFTSGDIGEEFRLTSRQLQTISASINLKEGFCKDITIGEVLVATEQKSQTTLGVAIAISTANTFCYGTIEFDFVGFKGSADFATSVVVPSVDLDLLLISSDLDKELPNSGCVGKCDASLQVSSLTIDNVKVDGISDAILSVLVDALQEPVADVVEQLGSDGKTLKRNDEGIHSEVESDAHYLGFLFTAICTQLDSLVPGLITQFLPQPSANGTSNATNQDLTVTNTVCTGFSVQNIDLASNRTSDELVVVPIGLDGFAIECVGAIRFALGSFAGTADFSIAAVANTLDISFGFLSTNFSTTPPSNVTLEACTAVLTAQSSSLSNLVVDGLDPTLTDVLLGLVDGLIGTVIETQGAACTYFGYRHCSLDVYL